MDFGFATLVVVLILTSAGATVSFWGLFDPASFHAARAAIQPWRRHRRRRRHLWP
jgi:hypothetical protein